MTNLFKLCIIIIGNGENHKRGLPQIKWFKTHLTRESFTDVFFLLVYSLLLKITANAIIKAIAMIVTPINE